MSAISSILWGVRHNGTHFHPAERTLLRPPPGRLFQSLLPALTIIATLPRSKLDENN
tara:strand:- start:14549 stop:14719 length:171 start_codon:yes stop_codon:yes gene_type:complete